MLAVDLLGAPRALERERKLRGQCLQRASHLTGGWLGAGDEQHAKDAAAHGQRQHEPARPAGGQLEAGEQLCVQVEPSGPVRSAVSEQAGGWVDGQRPGRPWGVAAARDGGERAVAAEAHHPRAGTREQRLDHVQHSSLHLLRHGARHERGATGVEQALVGDRALLLAEEIDHPQHDEAEQDDRGADDHDQVDFEPVQLTHEDAHGRDHRACEQAEAHRREPCFAVARGFLQRGHRGMQRRRAQQEREAHPPQLKYQVVGLDGAV